MGKASANKAGANLNNAPIELRQITKTFDQAGVKVTALDSVSLTIATGEFLALQGPSGSGKSTLLHILGLLDRPSSGTYILNGRDVSTLPDDRLSELRNLHIGFVFQSFYLIPYIPTLENVLMPGLYGNRSRTALRRRAMELLELVGLGDRASFKPNQLSGGQQQRVALARALINDPELILADEPTGQLDSKTGQEIMELLTTVNSQGKTVVVVTHDDETASYARKRVLVRDGKAREE